jgi:deoxycytidylate deaminase
MQYLKDNEEKEAIKYFNICAELAKKATCLRDKCGSIIVKDNEIIGQGINSPPGNLESQRRCNFDKTKYHKKIKDTTCCIHAEQRAIFDALEHNANKIKGSTLYFMRLDENENLTKAGKPYCTICSKFALDTGIKEFVLWHKEGICVYNTEEYNTLSYQYNEN